LAVTNFEHPYRHHRWVPDLSIGYEHAFVQAIADCPNGVETGAPAEPTFRTALQTQKVCDAILQSAKTGQWVETGAAA
jgi:predicted dehydrogenase